MAKKVRMPFTQAGILGFSSDEVAGGLLIKPEHIIIASLVFVLAIKLATIIIYYKESGLF